MKNNKSIKIEIQRYIPEQHAKPEFKTFEIPFIEEWSMLDALGHIKDELDTSLSYRWSCRMAICGSCGMVINGDERLGCETFLRDYYPNAIRVQPLKNFAIERDLVIDQEDFLEKLTRIKPFIIDATDNNQATDDEPVTAATQRETIQAGEYKQTPTQLAMFNQYSMCINCLLCYSACPQFGLNSEFVGPSVLALANRYNEDSRDCGSNQRQQAVNEKNGVWSCTFVGYCSEVCPKNVDPAAAIQQQKIAGARDWAFSWFSSKGDNK